MASPFTLLTADLLGPGLLGLPQWGIFGQGGQPLLQADSVFSIEYARDYKISDAPQEQGAFMSYNKVQVPYTAKVSFLANQLRYNFLAEVEPAVASLDFVSVVMPEFTYTNANLTHYGFRRTARAGKTLILFDVWAEEIRIVGSPQPAQTQSTNAAVPTTTGQLQTTPPGNTTFSNLPTPPPTATPQVPPDFSPQKIFSPDTGP
jgi:hypothetical protein